MSRPLALRLYYACLALLPARFRKRYAGEMTAAATELLAHATGRGRTGRLAVGASLAIDLLQCAWSEWRRELRRHRTGERPRAPRLAVGLAHDLRLAVRRARREPLVSLAAVVTLALGIGAATAVFTVVSSVLLRPLAYDEPEALAAVFFDEPSSARAPASPAAFLHWSSHATTFESLAAATVWSPALTSDPGPDELHGLRVTPGLFPLLRAGPMLGRTLAASDAGPAADPVIVLGHGLWQRRFGGDPAIVGTTVTLDGRPHTVAGVMPPDFRFPPFWNTRAEFWAPLVFSPEDAGRHGRFLRAFGRLAEGETIESASAEMRVLTAGLAERFPDRYADVGVTVEPLHEPVVGPVRRPLLLLLAAVGIVALIACANVANLQLVRLTGRARELAVQAALGADRFRLVRLLTVESLVLAVAGGLAGWWLGRQGVALLTAAVADNLPRRDEIAMDTSVLAFAVAATCGCALLFGGLPALQIRRANLEKTLRGARQTGGPQRSAIRTGLVVSQMALSLTLLVSAGLLSRSFASLVQLDPGFRKERLLTMSLLLSGSAHTDPARQVLLFDQVLERLRALPDVERAAFVNHLPFGGDIWGIPFAAGDAPPPPSGEWPRASLRTATPGYFETLGVPLLRGRDFSPDDDEDAPRVVVVNRLLARQTWGTDAAAGRTLRAGTGSEGDPTYTVIGVVGDVRQWDLTEEIRPEIYFPYRQNPVGWYLTTSLAVHTRGAAPPIAGRVAQEIHAVDPTLPVTSVRSMDAILADTLWRQRFATVLFLTLAALASLLAVVGLYGVVSHATRQRTSEIGIRTALGATRAQIVTLFVRHGLRMTLAGAILGLAGAALASRFLASLLFGVGSLDPVTYGAATVLLGAVAIAASYLPARRAARADPLKALRIE